tara:strand:+ start:13134 stop:13445 length:312 start_codon:yes stop_codon:yes gene_type:complete
MKKFLFFANSTSDAALLLAGSLVEMAIDSNGDSLNMSFEDVNGSLGATTSIALTITAHSGQEVMNSISEEITFGENAMIVIADEINSIFFHDDITAVTNAITV